MLLSLTLTFTMAMDNNLLPGLIIRKSRPWQRIRRSRSGQPLGILVCMTSTRIPVKWVMRRKCVMQAYVLRTHMDKPCGMFTYSRGRPTRNSGTCTEIDIPLYSRKRGTFFDSTRNDSGKRTNGILCPPHPRCCSDV